MYNTWSPIVNKLIVSQQWPAPKSVLNWGNCLTSTWLVDWMANSPNLFLWTEGRLRQYKEVGAEKLHLYHSYWLMDLVATFFSTTHSAWAFVLISLNKWRCLCRYAGPSKKSIYLCLVYLIGTDTTYIDKLENSYPMQVSQCLCRITLDLCTMWICYRQTPVCV